jgi:hypothetical protein
MSAALAETVKKGAARYRERMSNAFARFKKSKVEICEIDPMLPDTMNMQLLADAVHYLFETAGPAVAKDLIALAPQGGITTPMREERAAKLLAQRRELFEKLKELYQTMEGMGFTPMYRPDFDPEILLEWKSITEWNRDVLEALRERCAERRHTNSKLNEKRQEILKDREKLERVAQVVNLKRGPIKRTLRTITRCADTISPPRSPVANPGTEHSYSESSFLVQRANESALFDPLHVRGFDQQVGIGFRCLRVLVRENVQRGLDDLQ